MKHILTFAALVLATACCGQSYNLIVDLWSDAYYGETYRFYVEANDPTDKLSAVFGTSEAPMFVTPDGIYNSTLCLEDGPWGPPGAPDAGGGIPDPFDPDPPWPSSCPDPAFFPFFPELAFDSFITANGCIGHSLFPPLAESPYFSPLSSYFTSGGTEVQTDEGWYLLNSSPCSNTPDEFGLWWIAQVVTTGSISGTIHVQIFPLGEGANQVQLSFDFDGAGVFPATGDAIPGCTQSLIHNSEPTTRN